MSSTRTRIPRRSSIWSILKSLETLPSPPSWSSIDSLGTDPRFGSIPLIFCDGDGGADLPDSIGHVLEQDVSLQRFGTTSLLDHSMEEEVQPIRDDKTSAAPLTKNTKSLESTSPRTPMNGSTTLSTTLVHGFPLPMSPSRSARLREDSRSATGVISPTKGSRLHERDGSTSRSSNLLPTIPDAARTFSETPDVFTRSPLLPLSLYWLKSTVLELMIDQEGFRMTQPTFRFAGYSHPPVIESAAAPLGSHLVSATADFMPVERKSFTFHHASLDTPPVFRRLLVNGDGSHDYLSRQAYLILKANGPYSVHGTEPVLSSRLFSDTGPPVLTWRFDYFVGDRRTEAGKIIPGEKTLTPLSFSCSPGLLQPTQARKIRVVHVVKKSVAPKLTAIKMEPPSPPHCHVVPTSVPIHNAASEHQEINSMSHGCILSHARRSEVTRVSKQPTSSVSVQGSHASFQHHADFPL